VHTRDGVAERESPGLVTKDSAIDLLYGLYAVYGPLYSLLPLMLLFKARPGRMGLTAARGVARS
jgi:hypothetical protein